MMFLFIRNFGSWFICGVFNFVEAGEATCALTGSSIVNVWTVWVDSIVTRFGIVFYSYYSSELVAHEYVVPEEVYTHFFYKNVLSPDLR